VPTVVVTAFDVRSFARSLAIGLVVSLLAAVVMSVTDGDPGGLATRVARLGALAPVFGALGSSLALAQARGRGELLALESIGVPAWRQAAAAVGAAMLLGAAGAVSAVSRASNLDALFPRVAQSDWVLLADGAWSSASAGARLGESGLEWTGAGAAQVPAAAASSLAVLFAILAASVALPVWLQVRHRVGERLAVGIAAALGQVALLHLVGAARVSAWTLVLSPALLLGHWLLRK
jgi:hypothetical protein